MKTRAGTNEDSSLSDSLNVQNLGAAQEDDPVLTELSHLKESYAVKAEWNTIPRGIDELRTYWVQWESVEIRDPLLYRRFVCSDGSAKYYQLVVPSSLRSAFIVQACGSMTGGHFGIRCTEYQIQ